MLTLSGVTKASFANSLMFSGCKDVVDIRTSSSLWTEATSVCFTAEETLDFLSLSLSTQISRKTF